MLKLALQIELMLFGRFLFVEVSDGDRSLTIDHYARQRHVTSFLRGAFNTRLDARENSFFGANDFST